MVIDHIGILLLPEVDELRIIGRIAFVLFAFMITEGVRHTKDIRKYIFRLGTWAVLSEVPFDLAINNKWLEFKSQNVLFTFLIASVGLYVFKTFKSKIHHVLITLFTIMAGATLGFDYGSYGVALIYIFYLIRDTAIKLVIAQMLNTVATFFINIFQVWAVLGLLFLPFYNGRKGYDLGKIIYAFYPLHLLVLYIVKIV